MDMLVTAFVHILYASLAASIIIVLLFLVKRFLGDRLSARVYHMLWILVLIRLMMPFEIESPYNITDLFPEGYSIGYSQEDLNNSAHEGNGNIIRPTFTGLDGANNQTAADSWVNITMISVIWLIGCVTMTAFYAFAALRFKRISRNFTEVCDPDIMAIAQQSCARLKITKSIPVYTDTYFHSPCITGIFNPKICLPQNISEQIQYHQLEHVLLHELAHYKRKDLIYSIGAVISVIIHWFNPLVWLAIREMRYDREVVADLYVLELLGETAVVPYGTTLIKLASLFPARSAPLNFASFNETKTALERRIHMIRSFREGAYRIPALTVIIVLLLGTLTLSLTSCTQQPANSFLDANSPAASHNLIDAVVIIDPGHGGTDDGGVYPDPQSPEVKEKDINLAIAIRLTELLQKSGIQVVMTRQDDSTVQLDERVEMVNSSQADLLVSIHQESHFDESKNGTRTMYYISDDVMDKEMASKKAAQIIHNTLIQSLDTENLETSSVKAKILNETQIPAVATNIAYLSNESDREKLLNADFQQKAAHALHNGIIEVLKEMD